MDLGAGQQSIDHWALGIIFWSGRHMNLNDPFSSLPLLPRMLRCMLVRFLLLRFFARRFDTSCSLCSDWNLSSSFFVFYFAVHPEALFIHILRERDDDDFSILAFMRLPYLSLRIEPFSWELIIFLLLDSRFFFLLFGIGFAVCS
jgi:hypothetical protein